MSRFENSIASGDKQATLIEFQKWGTSLPRPLADILGRPMERLLSIHHINRAYTNSREQADGQSAFGSWLKSLDITYRLWAPWLSQLPATGPTLITANHPFGGLEGIILGDILCRLRSDVKILGNHLLTMVPELQPYLIPVNVVSGKKSTSANAVAMKAAIKWLQQGGCLITFPAGTVSHFQFSAGKSVDPAWSSHIATLIRKSRATVIPAYFAGRNSMLFQAAGLVNARLRTALLPQELVNKRTKNIDLQFGHPIAWGTLRGLADDSTLINHLRVKTYLLANRLPQKAAETAAAIAQAVRSEPVATCLPTSFHDTCWEIDNLPPARLLARNKQFAVYRANAQEIPGLLLKIGQLREITFRQEGEGTGKKTDLDRFDLSYQHLILWDTEARRPAGAYRFCLSDDIIAKEGIQGLYTNTLFSYKDSFFKETGPAMELGRSFIRPEYQGNPLGLALLWQAIGAFIGQNPQYSHLFGPLTISNSYHDVSKNILVDFLRMTCADHHLGHYVRPRTPFRANKRYGVSRKLLYSCLCSIDDVANIIRQVERDSKGVPILLRHYLKLNARFVDFNIDANFANAIDGLMVVNLTKTPVRFLRRFMGKEGCQNFLAFHKLQEQSTLHRAV